MLTEAEILEIFRKETTGDLLSTEEKHSTILEYGKKFDCNVFVETGTEKGDTVEAMRPYFSKIYSIELGPNYWAAAAMRFVMYPHIRILNGDSGEILPTLLSTISQKESKIIFWLDAHWKYDSIVTEKSNPTTEELDAIFRFCPNSIVLIDDARRFTGENRFGNCTPRLDVLENYVTKTNLNLTFEIKSDIIRIHP